MLSVVSQIPVTWSWAGFRRKTKDVMTRKAPPDTWLSPLNDVFFLPCRAVPCLLRRWKHHPSVRRKVAEVARRRLCQRKPHRLPPRWASFRRSLFSLRVPWNIMKQDESPRTRMLTRILIDKNNTCRIFWTYLWGTPTHYCATLSWIILLWQIYFTLLWEALL